MNFRLETTNKSSQPPLETKTHNSELELDTPYSRRRLTQRINLTLQLTEHNIDKFLERNNIRFIKIDEEFDDSQVAKNLNFSSSLNPNKLTNASEAMDESRRSSLSSFNFESNPLLLRRKTSTQQPNLSFIKENSEIKN